jgi:hypothetical protein
VFSQLVKPGIKRLVNEVFAGVQYLLSQQEYDELAAEEVVSRRFAIGWDTLILPFKVFNVTHFLTVGRSHAKQLSKSSQSFCQIPRRPP